MREVEILKSTLIYCQVCADKSVPLARVTDFVNRVNPTGIDSNWKVTHTNLAGDDTQPVDCASDSARRHYLFNC